MLSVRLLLLLTALLAIPAGPAAGQSPSPAGATTPLARDEVERFARNWFALFDRKAPVQEAQTFVVDQGLEMRLVVSTVRTVEGFREWYRKSTAWKARTIHEIQKLTVKPGAGETRVDLVVRWSAPAKSGPWIEVRTRQEWVVVRSPVTGLPRIKTCRIFQLH